MARIEQHCATAPGWLDTQHVEHAPLFLAFPEPMRELMMIYSELDASHRRVLTATARALREVKQGDCDTSE